MKLFGPGGRAWLAAGLVIVCSVLGLTAIRVRVATTPPRAAAAGVDFEAMGLDVSRTRFPAADGVELDAFRIDGEAGFPWILLCHDWGSSAEDLLQLAIELHERGFPVLAFDFRGHGRSAGRGSTLGIVEARDVVGAVDALRRERGAAGDRVGVYGVGMGAHAAVLAALERPAIRVLVLDGLYPDPAFDLVRRFYGPWLDRVPRADFLPVGVFSVMAGAWPARPVADAALAAMGGRDVLFLAPGGDPSLSAEIERMYHTVPVGPDADGNLIVVPSSGTDGRYGEDRALRNGPVADFLSDRLLPAGPPAQG